MGIGDWAQSPKYFLNILLIDFIKSYQYKIYFIYLNKTIKNDKNTY